MTDTGLYTVHAPMIRKARAGIPLGTCVYSGWLANEPYATALSNFQQITPEVEGGYWWVYGANPHGWAGMDRLVEYAKNYGMEVFYHCLRWWWEDQPPDIEAWITEAMKRYPSVYAWAVCNEAWNCWTGEPMYSQIEESFEIARRVRPDCQLWYNGLLFNSLEQSRVMDLIDLGLVDAVGIQMHHDLNSPLDCYQPIIEYLISCHIPWAITEYDCIIPNTLPETLQRQAECYRQTAQFCLGYGAEWLGMWGVADCVSWQYAYYPLPFARDYSPKPAWAAIQNVLR